MIVIFKNNLYRNNGFPAKLVPWVRGAAFLEKASDDKRLRSLHVQVDGDAGQRLRPSAGAASLMS